jgi:hypothetical protein
MGESQAENARHPNEFAAIQPPVCDRPRMLDAGERRSPITASMLCRPKLPPLGDKPELAVNGRRSELRTLSRPRPR